MTAVGFEQLTVELGGRPAVRDVTADLPAGTVTALVGGDGAGKTTLLRCLAGRLAPSSGRVHRVPVERTGVLTADPPGYDDLTVDENLAFVARIRGLEGAEARGRIDELLSATGLSSARARRADRLSGGMRRKLGLALATLHAPDVLLLDEPTTGVDPVSRAQLWRSMTDAARTGAVVVLATTYLDEAERCAGVLALDRGRVLVSGDPEAIVDDVRGQVHEQSHPGPDRRSWRRGATWRVWSPDGAPPGDAHPVDPDLEDAVVVAMLRRAAERADEEVPA